MEKVFLVIYKDHDSIEGYVNSYEDFKRWLEEWNLRRKEEGETEEYEDEFELKEVYKL